MGKAFAVVVAVIVLLTAGAILIVHRVTEPLPPARATAASRAAPAEAPPELTPPPPVQADRPASAPAPVTPVVVPGPSPALPDQPPAPVAEPAVPEETERRPPPRQRLNRGSRPNRAAMANEIE